MFRGEFKRGSAMKTSDKLTLPVRDHVIWFTILITVVSLLCGFFFLNAPDPGYEKPQNVDLTGTTLEFFEVTRVYSSSNFAMIDLPFDYSFNISSFSNPSGQSLFVDQISFQPSYSCTYLC